MGETTYINKAVKFRIEDYFPNQIHTNCPFNNLEFIFVNFFIPSKIGGCIIMLNVEKKIQQNIKTLPVIVHSFSKC